MNTNTNINSIQSYLQAITGIALAVPLLLTTSWPQAVLAFHEKAQPSHSIVFQIRPSLSLALLTAPIAEGTILDIEASAYSSTVEQTDGDPFTTASGTQVRDGVIAANFLPIGTIVKIGTRQYVVEDRLNSRYNGTLRTDIWMPTTEAALIFGVRNSTLEVISLP